MLGLYVWIAFFVGYYHDKGSGIGMTLWAERVMVSAMVVLGVIGLIQLMELPFRSTASQFIFRLALINSKGKRASIQRLFIRWAIVWLGLFVSILFVSLLIKRAEVTAALILAAVVLVLWISAAVYAVICPNRGLHDKLAGTWVVRW